MTAYWRWGVGAAAGVLVAFLWGTSPRSEEPALAKPTGQTEPAPRRPPAQGLPSGRAPTSPVAVSDPRAEHYDPVALQQRTDRSTSEIFSAEPRREEWATDFESALSGYVAEAIGELFPEVSVSVECRTASCELRYGTESIEGTELKMFREYVQLFVPLGATMSPQRTVDEDGRPVYAITALLSLDMLDSDSFFAFTRQFRDFSAAREKEASLIIRGFRNQEQRDEE